MPDPETKAAPKRAIDWEAIERDYRASVLSLREIAKIHGCSHVAIAKRAKAEGWIRDLGAKIQAKADDLVNRAAVTTEVNSQQAVTERAAVEAGAMAIAEIRLSHRSDIRRGRALVVTLLSELEAETGSAEALDDLGELMRNPGAGGVDRLNDLYRKIISLPGRIDSAKKLSEALRNLVALEREAWGLSSTAGDSTAETPGSVAGMPLQEATRVYQDFISAG